MSIRSPVLSLTILVIGLVNVTSGVYLDKTIWLPDSLGGVLFPFRVIYHPGNNTVYILDDCLGYILAIDATTHEKIARIPVVDGSWQLCLDTTAHRLYCGGYDEGLTVVDCQTNTAVAQFEELDADAGVSYSAASEKVYCASEMDDTLKVLDRRTFEVIGRAIVGDAVVGMAYNSTDDKLYVAAEEGGSRSLSVVHCSTDSVAYVAVDSMECAYCPVWDPVRNRVLCFFEGPERSYVAAIDCATDSIVVLNPLLFEVFDESYACLDQESRKLYCASSDEVLIVVDADAVRPMTYLPLSDLPVSIAVNTTANEIYCGLEDPDSFNLLVVDGSGDSIIARMDVPEAPVGLCYVPGQDEMFCCSDWAGMVSVLDGVSREVTDTVVTGVWPGAVLFNPVTTKLYVLDHDQQTLTVIDVIGDIPVARIALPAPSGMPVCGSGNGRVCCLTDWRRSITVIDGRGDNVRTEIGTPVRMEELLYVPSHNKLYGASRDSGFVVICCSSEMLAGFVPMDEPVSGMCYDPVDDVVLAFHGYGTSTQLLVIDAGGDSVLRQMALGERPTARVYNPINNRFYFSVGREVKALDPVRDSVPEPILDLSFAIGGLCLNTDGDKLYVLTSSGPINVVDCSSDSLVGTVPLPFEHLTGYCYNPTTNRLFVDKSDDDMIVGIDGRSDSIFWTTNEIRFPQATLCDPVASRLYIASPMGVSVFQDSLGRAVSGTGLTSRVLVGPTLVLEGGPGVMYDMTGRKVKALSRGQNDIREISSGVYVIRQEANGDTPGAVHKVVIQK
jgi:DNA-binding beta-propeller fold protein YncE